MKAVAITAHFDGEKVQFDEPCQLETNARLVVVVLPPEDERQAWFRLSASQLAKAYGDNEPEYTPQICAHERRRYRPRPASPSRWPDQEPPRRLAAAAASFRRFLDLWRQHPTPPARRRL